MAAAIVGGALTTLAIFVAFWSRLRTRGVKPGPIWILAVVAGICTFGAAIAIQVQPGLTPLVFVVWGGLMLADIFGLGSVLLRRSVG
jgi:hypothetical protein